MDTIYAEATPPGRGGVSVVRLSGPEAWRIGEAIAGPLPAAGEARLRHLRDGEPIDTGLVLCFAPGASFTGEAVVEFQLHGAPVVVRRLMQALAARGARAAGAGEFTRRAFAAGRLDLTQVAGLSDLLAAETEAQRRLAVRNAEGELGRRARVWRDDLLVAGALIMASLDFPDEEAPTDVPAEALERVARVRGELGDVLAGAAAAERLRKGFVVAIVGPPNVGKSSFLNHIAAREMALVTPVPGTTRDSIELQTELGGLAVTFVDTAGLRETVDEVEALGIARARRVAAEADLRLHLGEDGAVDKGLWREGDLAVTTKADLGNVGARAVSARTGQGVVALLQEVERRLGERVAGASLVAHEAQADRLREADAALANVAALPGELAGEEFARATRALDALLGTVDVEDYLGLVFSRFCIGK